MTLINQLEEHCHPAYLEEDLAISTLIDLYWWTIWQWVGWALPLCRPVQVRLDITCFPFLAYYTSTSVQVGFLWPCFYGFFVLVRPSQLEGIVADLTATRNWERHEIEEMTSWQQLDSGFHIVLQCLDHSLHWDYMTLVPEDLFFLCGWAYCWGFRYDVLFGRFKISSR